MSSYNRYAKKASTKASKNSIGIPRPNAIDRQGGIGIGAIIAVVSVVAVAAAGVANAVNEENQRIANEQSANSVRNASQKISK